MSMNDPSPYERMEAPEPAPEQEPQQKRNKWLPFVGVCVMLVVIVLAAFGWFTGEVGISGADRALDNVEIIDIAGTIGGSDSYSQSFINERIEIAQDDPNNVAIMLLIDSTGGAVYESDETYVNLMNYKEETGRPVYAYCEEYCASGGYYIAAAADEIVANRNSFVGSIGVICGQFVDATALLERLGIEITAIHSGANKLMGANYETPTAEQLAIYQALSDEIYGRFVGIVAESRGMSTEEVTALADGRIYSASQALENGLLDGIATLDEFEEQLREELGEDISFYHERYEVSFADQLWSYLSSFAQSWRAGSSELASTVEVLDAMTYSEPMLIYQGGEN